MSHKTIIISGYVSGDAQKKKVKYLERLDDILRSKGYRVLLVNLGRLKPDTVCDYSGSPKFDDNATYIYGRHFLHLEDLPPEILQAAAVEAETERISFVAAAVKIILFVSYLKDLFLKTTPSLCLIWHEFNGRHYALRYVCREMGIPYLYIEYGVLPGTVNVDEEGQMGESWVTRRYDKFRVLPVSENDLEVAAQYIDFIRESKQSRKPQDSTLSIKPIAERARQRGRKIIFCAGQNDWGSGMLPPWIKGAKIHSPYYVDTIDALMHLAELAGENDWHILFKPHPLVADRLKDIKSIVHDRIDLIPGANIFECFEESDVTVTILSGVSYLAMVHLQPVVLLGRIQLYKKGCAYEIHDRERLEKVMTEALQDGFTPDHQRRWLKHVAQLIKYYLFSLEETTAQIIGKDVVELSDYLIGQIEAEKPPNVKKRLDSLVGSRVPAFKLPLGFRMRYTLSPDGSLCRKPKNFIKNLYLKLKKSPEHQPEELI
ncbi:MAG: hypothetical protein GY950_13960 [bacterium]|nr:hypothetical protein [bacterium]